MNNLIKETYTKVIKEAGLPFQFVLALINGDQEFLRHVKLNLSDQDQVMLLLNRHRLNLCLSAKLQSKLECFSPENIPVIHKRVKKKRTGN